MTTTLGDAKIIVKLELPKGPAEPEKHKPDGEGETGRDGRDGAGGRDGRDERSSRGGDESFDWYGTAKGLAAAATYSGGLYAESLAAAQAGLNALPIPGSGAAAGALRLAELTRAYGPAVASGFKRYVDRATEGVPGGETARAVADEALDLATKVSESLNQVKADLDALGQTFQTSLEAAAGAEVLGGIDAGDLGGFAANLYRVNQAQGSLGLRLRQRARILVGEAIGDVAADVGERLMAGASGR